MVRRVHRSALGNPIDRGPPLDHRAGHLVAERGGRGPRNRAPCPNGPHRGVWSSAHRGSRCCGRRSGHRQSRRCGRTSGNRGSRRCGRTSGRHHDAPGSGRRRDDASTAMHRRGRRTADRHRVRTNDQIPRDRVTDHHHAARTSAQRPHGLRTDRPGGVRTNGPRPHDDRQCAVPRDPTRGNPRAVPTSDRLPWWRCDGPRSGIRSSAAGPGIRCLAGSRMRHPTRHGIRPDGLPYVPLPHDARTSPSWTDGRRHDDPATSHPTCVRRPPGASLRTPHGIGRPGCPRGARSSPRPRAVGRTPSCGPHHHGPSGRQIEHCHRRTRPTGESSGELPRSRPKLVHGPRNRGTPTDRGDRRSVLGVHDPASPSSSPTSVVLERGARAHASTHGNPPRAHPGVHRESP